MTSSSSVRTPPASGRTGGVHPAYRVLIGLTALAIVLQGLWAGIFLEHDGKRDDASGWISVHSAGGEVAIALAVLATIVAFVKMRPRKEVWGGTAVLAVLLVLESFLGGLIVDHGQDALTAVHVPLAMTLVALVVYLAFQARRTDA